MWMDKETILNVSNVMTLYLFFLVILPDFDKHSSTQKTRLCQSVEAGLDNRAKQ